MGGPSYRLRARARASGVTLTPADAAVAKGMLTRGDRQHDVASWFGVNAGRIAEIATGRAFRNVEPVDGPLPPPGPYPSGRQVAVALDALAHAETAIEAACEMVRATFAA